MSEGDSNIEIAERLELSPLTVKSHLARISAKLEAKNRAHIVGLVAAQRERDRLATPSPDWERELMEQWKREQELVCPSSEG